nr:protein N terminal glutamine [Hymenolepis microstoma]
MQLPPEFANYFTSACSISLVQMKYPIDFAFKWRSSHRTCLICFPPPDCCNLTRKVPLFFQKSGRSPDGVVVWDYHVIVILRFNYDVKFQICDLDTTLDFPCDASEYWSLAIRPNSFYKEEFYRFFRIIDGEMYLRYFASDRSHMRTADGWLAPPPNYGVISTSKSTHNLPQYMDFPPHSDGSLSLLKQQLDSAPFGVVTTEGVFCNFFGIAT